MKKELVGDPVGQAASETLKLAVNVAEMIGAEQVDILKKDGKINEAGAVSETVKLIVKTIQEKGRV